MSGWQRGHAALVHGEWPAHVLGVDAPRQRATVRFLGGSAPEGLKPEATVALAALVRPTGARWLDRSPRFVRSARPAWTGEELRRLRAGWNLRPRAELVAELGRTERACEIALFRWWGTKSPHAGDRVMTSRRVARILGWDDHRVQRLIHEGALRATKSAVGAGANQRWAVTDEDLDAFLVAHRARYDWRQVEPGYWHARAAAIDRADPLLDVEETARRLYVVPSVVLRHIRRGWLPAVWSDGGRAGSQRRWLVRASDLDRFTYKPTMARWRRRRDAALHRRGLTTVAEAAQRLGCLPGAVAHRIRRGTLPAERVLVGGRWALGVRLPAADGRAA